VSVRTCISTSTSVLAAVNVSATGQIVVRGGGIAIVAENTSISNKGLISIDTGDAIVSGGEITLKNTGTIYAGGLNFAIKKFGVSVLNKDVIANSGLIDGFVDLSVGADSVINSGNGRITKSVTLGAGADKYIGGKFKDTVLGGDGADKITGGGGRDFLSGNTGTSANDGDSDAFVYTKLSDSGKTSATRDFITDFVHDTDFIDLHLIDANTKTAINNKFIWQSAQGAAFTGKAGEIHHTWQNQAGTANDRTIISADVNGDKSADFSIELFHLVKLTAADFIL
jgi:hypothetical protein